MENTQLLRHFLLCNYLANEILAAQGLEKTNFAKLLWEYFYANKKDNRQMLYIFMAISESILAIQGNATTTFIELAENDEDFSLNDSADLSAKEIDDLTEKHLTQLTF